RLDSRPAAPGLRAVHATAAGDGARYFGPYLGGEKVRCALAALHRVLPLAYTGTALAGSERDMAGKRGVGPDDRTALVEALTAVRERDPGAAAAVRRELQARQDRAAQVLAFELAARLQAEIRALDWVVSPQRVTGSEPGDFEVYGWSAGLLVRF